MEKTETKQHTLGLLRRFWPYMARYKGIVVFDLFCAGLTTICELVLPQIMKYITNAAMGGAATLTA